MARISVLEAQADTFSERINVLEKHGMDFNEQFEKQASMLNERINSLEAQLAQPIEDDAQKQYNIFSHKLERQASMFTERILAIEEQLAQPN
jgi:chaperonin cofactor prefoldin